MSKNTNCGQAFNTSAQDQITELWCLNQVLAHIPISRSSWFAGVKAGRYPQPVRLSDRRVAWRASDIRAFISVGAVPTLNECQNDVEADLMPNKEMSLRDYFAAKALQGAAAYGTNSVDAEQQYDVAVWCYQMADAMLAARTD